LPLESEETEVLEEAFVFREGVEEEAEAAEEDPLEGLEAVSLLMAGSLGAPAEVGSFCVSYSAQSPSTMARLKGLRLSKLADRLSKQ
jgi:hypothetical protein